MAQGPLLEMTFKYHSCYFTTCKWTVQKCSFFCYFTKWLCLGFHNYCAVLDALGYLHGRNVDLKAMMWIQCWGLHFLFTGGLMNLLVTLVLIWNRSAVSLSREGRLLSLPSWTETTICSSGIVKSRAKHFLLWKWEELSAEFGCSSCVTEIYWAHLSSLIAWLWLCSEQPLFWCICSRTLLYQEKWVFSQLLVMDMHTNQASVIPVWLCGASVSSRVLIWNSCQL